MSHVRIHVDLDNAAFEGDDLGPELARVLRKIANAVEVTSRSDLEGHEFGQRDSNGNKCAYCDFEIDDEPTPLSKADEEIKDFVDELEPRTVLALLEEFEFEPYRDDDGLDDEANADYLFELIRDGEIDFFNAQNRARVL